MATKNSEKTIHFEKAIEELENLVEQMEEGELSLEASLKTFEAGIKLTRECQSALHNAEQKVQILIQENGNDELAEFHEDEE
ncbi:MAG: exodeoxyribonuclease VII small subunit [Pseudomonadales bacterium]|nr:exodeoxyribonuclease VII small subunit [Pseudomonadales bacterium]